MLKTLARWSNSFKPSHYLQAATNFMVTNIPRLQHKKIAHFLLNLSYKTTTCVYLEYIHGVESKTFRRNVPLIED